MRKQRYKNAKNYRHNMTKDYLERCLKLSPERRLRILQEMYDFTKKAMPKETKELCIKLYRG